MLSTGHSAEDESREWPTSAAATLRVWPQAGDLVSTYVLNMNNLFTPHLLITQAKDTDSASSISSHQSLQPFTSSSTHLSPTQTSSPQMPSPSPVCLRPATTTGAFGRRRSSTVEREEAEREEHERYRLSTPIGNSRVRSRRERHVRSVMSQSHMELPNPLRTRAW